tara:strand:- start:1771 stop:2043 length:273 start_codon:yes stop_codon:yes gene_type:complete
MGRGRGRPKKKENMTPLEFINALESERQDRKEALFDFLVEEERECIDAMIKSMRSLQVSYHELMHPTYDDIVKFDDNASWFMRVFSKGDD